MLAAAVTPPTLLFFTPTAYTAALGLSFHIVTLPVLINSIKKSNDQYEQTLTKILSPEIGIKLQEYLKETEEQEQIVNIINGYLDSKTKNP